MVAMQMREVVVGLVFGGAFVINPGLVTGCHFEEPFRFEESDVVALIADANQQGPYVFEERGERYEVTFTLRQKVGADARTSALEAPALTRSAHACTGRSFMRSAAACLDLTTAPVEGHAVVRHIAAVPTTLEGDVKGEVSIEGKKLDNAWVALETGSSDKGGFKLELRSRDGRTFVLEKVALRAP